MANSPARRLTPRATPAPLNLTTPGPADSIRPAETPVAAQPIVGEVVQMHGEPGASGSFTQTVTIPAEMETGAEEMTPEAFMTAAASMFGDIVAGADDPIIQAIEVMTNVITDRLNALTEAINIVGQQQQWTTDTIGKLKEEFDRVMGSGNPMRMIGALMGAGKGKGINNG